MLKVPANCPDPSSPDFSDCSPVRQINWVLAPDAICDNPDLAKSPAGGSAVRLHGCVDAEQ